MNKRLDNRSKKLRQNIIDSILASRRGHIGSAFSMIEILRVLYDEILYVNPKNPDMKKRDRFILSKGHGCLGLYSILYDKGFITKKELLSFCEKESILGGHPEKGKIPGVEASTGSLGHGLSLALGNAIGQKLNYKGKNMPRTFVLISDGECDEGSTWEAALSIGNKELDNLFVLVDYNKMQSYGAKKDVMNVEPLKRKWESFGFEVLETDGHDVEKIKKTLNKITRTKGKWLVIFHTIKGKGVPFIEQNPLWHHKSKITDEEIEKIRNAIEKI